MGWLVAAGFLSAPQARADVLYYDLDGYAKLAAAVSTSDGHVPIVYTEDRAPVYVLTRIVVDGSSADEWAEALEIMNTMRHDAPRKLAAWYDAFRAKGDAACESEWTVLAQTPASMTFERRSGDCPPHGEQHALYRVIYGKRQIFTLIATRKPGMDEATRGAWIGVLESAELQD
jgi:hypothetical protein